MSSRIVLLLLLCVGFAFWSKGSTEQPSCIVSGSIVREAANSAVSQPIADLDAVSLASSVSVGGNVDARPIGAILIVR